MNSCKTIELYNEFKLGDNVFGIIILNKIKDYIIDNDIIIKYYCNESWHKQIKEFVVCDNIIIEDINKKTQKSVNCWIGSKEFVHNFYDTKISYNDFYVLFANELYKKIDIPKEITKIEYEDFDLKYRYEKLNDIYKDVDILFINSMGTSNQYNDYLNDKDKWEKIIKKYNSKGKIVTTQKIDDVNCTTDMELSVKDIASISTNCKYVVAINTGPLVGCLNGYSLENVKKWIIFDTQIIPYSYPTFIHTNNAMDIIKNIKI